MRAVTGEHQPEPAHGAEWNPDAVNAGRKGRAASGAPLAEHALLGLIVHVGGEAHGYELARHFDTGQSLADVLHIEQSMLYQHLKKLERRGWLTVSLQPQGTRPPRQIYGITADGRAELHRWLEEPVVRTREIRLEFLVKLYFAFQLAPDLASRIVAEQRAVCEQLAASLAEQRDLFADRAQTAPPDATGAEDFPRMVLELRLAHTRAALAWLERVAAWNRPISPG